MRTATLLAAGALLLSLAGLTPIKAESQSSDIGSSKRRTHLWSVSVTALATANVADVCSSWGRPELNPTLGRGRFRGRGIGIKASLTGTAVLIQWLILRRNPKRAGLLAVINFGASAATGAVAIRNYNLIRRK